MKLEEGKTYMFNAIRTLELPGGNINLILSGPDGKKYLLPLEYYNGYNLKAPGVIECKVDKINCSGKVFLEPSNPFYREGETYDFEIVRLSEDNDEKGIVSKSFIINDIFGKSVRVPAELFEEIPEAGKMVRLRIDRISKGKLRFLSRKVTDDLVTLEEGKNYEFTVARIVNGPEDDQYYVAVDDNGDEHLLNVRYYSHYGFETGTTFSGKVVRYNNEGPKTIEPENPWFKPGDKVPVTLVSSAPMDTGDGFLCEGFDDNGISHTLVLSQQPEGKILICRVVKIRKGRPVLEWVEN